jgi:hypothetical protein
VSALRRVTVARALVLIAPAAAAIGGGLAFAGPGAVAAPSTDAIVLKASQVGTGYRSEVAPGGRQVANQVTLDLCYFRFPSESLRTARLQVLYEKAKSQPVISNEVVLYRSGGAAKALEELRYVLKHCTPVLRTGPAAGEQVPVRWHLTPLTVPHVTSSYVAVALDGTATVKGKRVTQGGFAVYEFAGNAMSGVYGYENGASAAATLALTIHAAQASADNLRAHPA